VPLAGYAYHIHEAPCDGFAGAYKRLPNCQTDNYFWLQEDIHASLSLLLSVVHDTALGVQAFRDGGVHNLVLRGLHWEDRNGC